MFNTPHSTIDLKRKLQNCPYCTCYEVLCTSTACGDLKPGKRQLFKFQQLQRDNCCFQLEHTALDDIC